MVVKKVGGRTLFQRCEERKANGDVSFYGVMLVFAERRGREREGFRVSEKSEGEKVEERERRGKVQCIK